MSATKSAARSLPSWLRVREKLCLQNSQRRLANQSMDTDCEHDRTLMHDLALEGHAGRSHDAARDRLYRDQLKSGYPLL